MIHSNMGNFVYNDGTGEIFQPSGAILNGTPKMFFSNSLPGTEGSGLFQTILMEAGRKWENRLDKSSGIPRFWADVYDLDGQVIVANYDYAVQVTDIVSHGYDQTRRRLVDEIRSIPQP